MIHGIYVIKDEKVGFLNVMQDSNDFSAVRNFRFAMNRPDSLYQANKSDFKLYKIGTFDTISGMIEIFDTLQLVADGASLEE